MLMRLMLKCQIRTVQYGTTNIIYSTTVPRTNPTEIHEEIEHSSS